MKKIYLKKELKHLYAPSAKKVEIIDVPKFNFVMVDGMIEPGKTPETSLEFQHAMTALYGAFYTLKFMSKQRQNNPVDYTVMALEGLWWTGGEGFDFDKTKAWNFKVMILQPEHITEEMYQKALQQLKKKKDNPALSKIQFESFQEGLCMQIMHIGPYDEEPWTIEKMQTFAQEQGYILRGQHHEIYLGDPRQCKPERLRTILQYPVKKRGE